MDTVGEEEGATGDPRADQRGDATGAPRAAPWQHAAPFALLAGDPGAVAPAGLAARLRRMGLRPEPAPDDPSTLIEGGAMRLSFGALSVLAGPPTPAMRAVIAPGAADVAVAGSVPAADWAERAMVFVPGHDAPDVGTPPPPAQRYFDRRFFELLVLLIDTFDADFLFWSPAGLWSRADQFRAAVAEMLGSGMPPVLHLVAFVGGGTVDDPRIVTRGLAHFTGQELTACPPAHFDQRAAVRRLARLALDMMINGPVTTARDFPGLDAGEMMQVRPEAPAGAAAAWLNVAWAARGA